MVEKRFAFDLELFTVARRLGFSNIVEVPVEIAERFTPSVSMKAVMRTLIETLGIFYRLRVLHYYDVSPKTSARYHRRIVREISETEASTED